MTREEAIKVLMSATVWTDEEREALGILIPELRESEDERIRKSIIKLLQQGGYMSTADKTKAFAWLERQKEQKEEDEHLLSAIQVQFASHAKVENGKRYAKLTWDEFKKIAFELCGCGKQKPAEWSEEDEGMLNCIIATLCEESHGGRETNDKMVTWLDNRLKFLRTKPHWKPSEEQMKALERASTNKYLSAEQFDILVSLYEQLKQYQHG